MGYDSTLSRIAFVGNYLPRLCGIATFTTDLCEAVAAQYHQTTCFALPINDIEAGYNYPSRVWFEITEKDIDSYRRASDFLNISNVDVVSLQHEYGIFGGPAGSHILALLRELRMPIVTTLHTILREPNPDQKLVLEEIASLSDRMVVMSERGAVFLNEIYGVPQDKIDLIPHGIPDVSFVDPSFYKDMFGVEGKTVLLTFGLLSANKGIENVIEALPAILSRHPNVVYIVLGATHPNVLLNEGETYRLSLHRLAQDNGVDGQVIFYNSFVSLEKLVEFIGAADIYITPYLNEAQITSGTLAYALGAGKAVVSTPYWYAEELLAEGRGMLVPFRDPAALAERVNNLLDNEINRHAIRKRAYVFGREMVWPRVAKRYMKSFISAREKRRHITCSDFAVKSLDKRNGELPPLKLEHLRRMTDDTGILQHAVLAVPNYGEGYTLDDNARALIVSVLLEALGEKTASELSPRYLAFIWYAFNNKRGCFRNYMDFQRHWLEEYGSDDSHGRALWALGTVLGRSNTPDLQSVAVMLFKKALPAILKTTSPRAWAFAIMGIQEYLQWFVGDSRANHIREELSGRLLKMYESHASDEWRWYEDRLSYCNAILPHAMLLCGHAMHNTVMTEAGLESMNWLVDLHHGDAECFVPIGSKGFYLKGGERAMFDQQPVEAQAMVSACLEAYRITLDAGWRREARYAFEWFLGRNILSLPVYDPTSGGCRDGLHSDRLNENQGAESTLAFLQALLELRMADTITIAPEDSSQ